MKEIELYKHCPYCKTDLSQKSQFLTYCSKCKRGLYLNPRPCAVGVIVKEGKILITQRARAPFAGEWDLPGGFLDYEDNLEEALKREMQEELGVEVEITRYLTSKSAVYDFGDVTNKVMPAYFECVITRGELTPQDDVAAFEWVNPSEHPRMCFPHDQEVIKEYFAI